MSSPQLDRLDFDLPNFAQVSWVSDNARQIWQPRLAAISRAWAELETLSVVAKIRACALVFVRPEELADRAAGWLEQGLITLPISLSNSESGYSSRTSRDATSHQVRHRVVVGEKEHLLEFKNAYDGSQHGVLGELLAYPSCCSDFFQRQWADARLMDTTWPMAACTRASILAGQTLTTESMVGPNILWRWLGIRAVPHLPCNFHCAESNELATQFIELGRSSGYAQEMDWLESVLSWPVEWSALHGIAEIKMPILKIATNTDATASKFIVRLNGHTYPEEGAEGSSFPYSRSADTSRPETVDRDPLPAWYSTDNGFRSMPEMREAHLPLVDAVIRATEKTTGTPAILDLGCGNGALLREILRHRPQLVPFGVDNQVGPIEHAKTLIPAHEANFYVGEIFETDAHWLPNLTDALVVVMAGRFVESDPHSARILRDRLLSTARGIILYAYPDTLKKLDLTFADLLERAGFEMVQPVEAVHVGVALLRKGSRYEQREG
jgi:SAM-dependent methyltransferase